MWVAITVANTHMVRLIEAVERLVKHYQVTGKVDEAAKWRKELDTCARQRINQRPSCERQSCTAHNRPHKNEPESKKEVLSSITGIQIPRRSYDSGDSEVFGRHWSLGHFSKLAKIGQKLSVGRILR